MAGHFSREAPMKEEECDGSDFCSLQFQALRAEILGIKERVVKHQLLGITGIPLIIGAGEKYDLSAILIVSPLITLAFALLLVFEQSSLMRAGEYIKDHIEPRLGPKDMWKWENWLQQNKKRRKPERFFACSAYILFAVYFAIGTIIAFTTLADEIGTVAAFVVLGLYCGGFVLAMHLVVVNFRTCTGQAREPAGDVSKTDKQG